MSTDVRTQTGQAPPAGRDAAPARAGGQSGPADPPRDNPQSFIQESIKYRRRAQEAERRAEALESELMSLREAQAGSAAGAEAELARARAEADALRTQLDQLQRDLSLERELLRAGCGDAETAMAVARERMAGGDPPEDLAAFAKALLDEKPHLRGPGSQAQPPLPPRTAGAKPAGDDSPRRAADRLAARARQSGATRDVIAYMRARRGASP